jgi:hypothetical protein
MKRDLPPGIFRARRGYRVFQWVPDPRYPKGRIASHRFPATATLDEMKRWRESQRVRARQRLTLAEANAAPVGLGFLADAERYLATVRAMPSWQERRREIRAWADRFGDQVRDTITSAQIRAARDAWLTVGPKRVQERQSDGSMQGVQKALPLAPQSVNLRLRALENLYTVLDGPNAPNPVRDVPECVPPDPLPKGETFSLGLEILSCMPDIHATEGRHRGTGIEKSRAL